MDLSLHFTTPFLTPDGWRLVITLVEHDYEPGHIPGEGIPVTLYGYLFPPPEAHEAPPPPDERGKHEPTVGQVHLLDDVMHMPSHTPPPRRLQGGCVMVAPPREQD